MCTAIRFNDDEGNVYEGRNLDWGVGYGEKPVLVPANFTWQSRHLGPQTTKHPLVGMGLLAGDLALYFDAANSCGLYCAGLSFAAGFSEFQKYDESKICVSSYEMPLWVTSNFESVDEVEKVLQNVIVTDDALEPKMPPSPLHWFISDKSRSIVVEQQADGLHVYSDDFDVMTNQPEFKFHMNNMRNYMHLDTEWTPNKRMGKAELTALGVGPSVIGLPGDPSSISRFVRVAYQNANYPTQSGETNNLSRLFHTLASVAMVKGCCKQESGNFEYTIYTGGFSSASNTYYYNLYDDPAYKSIRLADYSDITKPVSL